MVFSTPAKSEARLGIAFCRKDARSPLTDMSKYRCAALVMAVRNGASISLPVWQVWAAVFEGSNARRTIAMQYNLSLKHGDALPIRFYPLFQRVQNLADAAKVCPA